MNEKVENLILERLRPMRADLSYVREGIDVLKAEATATRQHVAGLIGHQTATEIRVARMEDRLERVERRLELRDQ